MSGRGLFSSFVDAVINGLSRIADKMMDKAIDKFLDIMFAGNNGTSAGAGGFIDSILGAVFGGGKVPMAGGAKNFAQGTVVDRPSLFTMAGGGIGRMGEAGEEAIMPLTRGPDGSLGVQSHGNKGGTTIYAPVTVNNDNRVTGAVSSEDIVAMQRAQAEQTKRELEREIPEILNRYQTDGAVAA
jgi:lambda family phage tail tape measure protein